MGDKQEELINFKVSKRFAERLRKEACDLDVSMSVFLRCCVKVGSPLLKDKKYLIPVLENTKDKNNGQ